MNDLEHLIQEIGERLSANDLTDSDELRRLALRYLRACNDFNAKVGECCAMLERRMIIEASQFADSLTPPLATQAELLAFPERPAFLELFTIYDWEMPPALNLDVINDLTASAAHLSHIKPLLDAYRQVARQDNDELKISILRKIVKLDDKDEWRKTLISLEERSFAKLANDAKEAIIAKDIDRLKQIQQALNNPEWLFQPNQLVVNKVNNVVEDDRLEKLGAEAATYLADINDAYSAFDYDNLQRLLSHWQHLLTDEGYNPDVAAQMQVDEANKWFSQQRQQRQDDEQFAQTLKALAAALNSEKPMTVIEPLMHTALSLERELPEELLARYRNYKQTQDDIARRKKLLKTTIIAAVVVAVMSMTSILAYVMITASLEKKWQTQLNEALANETSAVCQKLYDELAHKMPVISKRPAIAIFVTKINEKKNAEEQKRTSFQQLAADIREKLPAYEANEAFISNQKTTLLDYIVDSQEQALYENLKKEIDEAQQNYSFSQEQLYMDLIAQIREMRTDFFLAIETMNLAQADRVLKDAFVLREQAKAVKGVSMATKNQQEQFMSVLDDMQLRLQLLVDEVQQKKALWAAIQHAKNLDVLKERVDKFIQDFPDDARSPALRDFLQLQLIPAIAIAKWGNGLPAENDVGYQDFLELKQITDGCKALAAATKANFENLHKSLQNSPLYLFIFQGRDNDAMHYLYFKSSFTPNEIMETCNFRLMTNNNEASFPVEISYGQRSGYTIQGLNDSDSFLLAKMKLIYPTSIYKPKVAPHIDLVQDITMKTNQLNPENVETFLHDILLSSLDRQYMDPNLKLNFLKNISTLWSTSFPAAPISDYLENEVTKLSAILPFDYNWLRPSPLHENISSLLAEGLKKIRDRPFVPAITFRRNVLQMATGRNLQPVGYFLPADDKAATEEEATANLIIFPSAPTSGELWLYDPATRAFVIAGSYRGNTMTLSENTPMSLSSLAMVFSPLDNKATATLLAELKASAAQHGIGTISWPQTWPRNMQDAR